MMECTPRNCEYQTSTSHIFLGNDSEGHRVWGYLDLGPRILLESPKHTILYFHIMP